MKKITLVSFLLMFVANLSYGQAIESIKIYDGDNELRSQNGGDCGSVIPNATTVPDGLNGNPSQDFTEANDIFDSQSADDFTMSADGFICQVSVTGSFTAGGLDADVNSAIIVEILEDNAGLPGASLYTETFPGAGLDPEITGDFAVTLTGGPLLTEGTTYWVSVVAQLEFATGGQWFWDSSSDGVGNVWAFINPGDGFGTGCVEWTAGGACLGTTEPDRSMDIAFSEEPLSVDENEIAQSIRIFPNPTNGDLNLNVSRNLGNYNVNVINVSGQIVMKNSFDGVGSSTLQTSKLSNGIYFAQISSDEGNATIKFIKN